MVVSTAAANSSATRPSGAGGGGAGRPLRRASATADSYEVLRPEAASIASTSAERHVGNSRRVEKEVEKEVEKGRAP